ncbi:MAG: hypothetical protein F4237_12500 [Gemmatimonadetes bacterium]|nr:hypothetical protein [Gemmatimonadota bacterium]
MPTSARGKDGPKKKSAGPRLEERPFSDVELVKPGGLEPAVERMWDEIVASMPPDYFTAGDARTLQAYCVAVASWLAVLEDLADRYTEQSETTASRMERTFRAEFTGLAMALGIVPPLDRRNKRERPKGQLHMLDAYAAAN